MIQFHRTYTMAFQWYFSGGGVDSMSYIGFLDACEYIEANVYQSNNILVPNLFYKYYF